MKAGRSLTNGAMVDGLKPDIDSERVVIFSSNITDIRPITRHLERRKISYRVVRMGMGSQAMRDRFAHLKTKTGWDQLPQVFVDGRFIGGYDEFFAHDFSALENKARTHIPTAALTLGAGGLIPFLLGASALWWAPPGWRSDILLLLFAYGAIILTFTGAVHWGLAMRSTGVQGAGMWQRLGLSVVPALVAWISFSQTPVAAFVILIAAYIGQYVLDVFAVRVGWAPSWYLPLRSGLTGVVIACLLASVFALSTQQGLINRFPEGSASGAFTQDRGDPGLLRIGLSDHD